MLAIVAALLAAQAQAQTPATADWWYYNVLGDAGAQQAFYIDRASISRAGALAIVEEAREAERADEQNIIGARLRVRYDCSARTWQVLHYTFLLTDGRQHVASRAMTTPEPVEPGSISEDAMRIACGETEGIEQLRSLGIREQALLLFAERAEHLRTHPDARR
jgi:acyl carrier protein phosphodiesterase